MTDWRSMVRDCPEPDCRRIAYPYTVRDGVWSAQCGGGHVSHPQEVACPTTST